MARLKVKKHFSFAFLGDEWKDGYINFDAYTSQDILDNSDIGFDPANPDPKAVNANFNAVIERLKVKFIDGKIPNDDGTLDTLTKEDLGTLPLDIIQEAISFLSQSQVKNSQVPSVAS